MRDNSLDVHGRPHRLAVVVVLAVSVLPILTSCATYSTLHAAAVPPHSLRLAEVVYLVLRREIMREPSETWRDLVYKNLLASGVKDSDIEDGSVAMGRVYCCGGKTEKAFAFFFYVPGDIRVQPGDIVEVRSGPVVRFGEIIAPVNTVTRVLDKSACRWDPPDPRKLMRVLYCDWMEKEGWQRHKGSLADFGGWIKQP